MGILDFFRRSRRNYDDEIRQLESHIELVLKLRLDAKIARVTELWRLQKLPLDQFLEEIKKIKYPKLTSLGKKQQEQLEFEIGGILDEIEVVSATIEEKKRDRDLSAVA